MIAIFCGGTLGHIKPGLVMAKYLEEHGKNVIMFLTEKDIRFSNVINEYHNISKIIYIRCVGMVGSNLLKPTFYLNNYSAYKRIKKELKSNNVNKGIGFGGFISGIGILAANNIGIDTYLHEQNAIMGKANKISMTLVKKVFCSLDIKNIKSNEKIMITGNPTSDEAKKNSENIYKEKKRILITSGSLGADAINKLAIDLSNNKKINSYKVILVTGEKYFDDVKKQINNQKFNIYNKLVSLNQEMKKSDVIICRAGATTIAEILVLKPIPIFIPSPNVTMNHQYFNAEIFQKNKMGFIVKEEELNVDYIFSLLDEIEKNYNYYLNNLNNVLPKDVCKKIFEEVYTNAK